jgi:hypothetical protein
LIAGIDGLLVFLATHFFVFPRRQEASEDIRLCMHPDLNVDRGGMGEPEAVQRYSGLQAELDDLVRVVRKAYDSYRTAVKHSLYV